jgi:hypothetical protein
LTSSSTQTDQRAAIAKGDTVRTGPNHLPHYEVLAVRGDKAWVRDVAAGSDHLALVDRCRRVA